MFEREHNEKGGFYMMPRQLFTENCPLSLEAKVLYTMIIDRTDLSLKNDWRDKNGKVFVYFTVDEAAKMLGCSNKKAGNVFTELEHYMCITRKRQGLGKPSLVYLNRAMLPSFNRPPEITSQTSEKDVSRPVIFTGLDTSNLHTNYTNNNLN